ncbi:MAG: aminotransferase class V-fold PLP-dependent enzyme, partial [Gammaproteobacteria bacterium]
MSFDPVECRAQFPLFSATENAGLIYLDNAATTPMPSSVIEAISQYSSTDHANVHRASHRLARRATEHLEATRAKTAAFIHARTDEIVFTRGATEGLNLLVSVLSETWSRGDELIVGPAEHHANLLPWLRVAQMRGLTLRFLPLQADGYPEIDALSTLLTARTRVVAISAASNVLGYTLDVSRVAAYVRNSSALLIVDAAQAVAHERLDVTAMGCDFLVFSAHKVYGPTGLGVLYGRRECLACLPPWQLGGEMVRSVSETAMTFADPPHRFEAGTLPLGAIVGWSATVDFLARSDRSAWRVHERALAVQLMQELASIPALRLLSTRVNNLGVVTYALDASHNGCYGNGCYGDGRYGDVADLGLWLDQHDIAVRVGYHCAQPLYQRLVAAQGLRLSLAAYNTFADIERTIDVIRKWFEGALFYQKSFYQKPSYQKRSHQPECSSVYDVVDDLDVNALRAKQDWQSRYRMLMAWGNVIQPKPALRALATQRVAGCEAETWLAVTLDQGRYWFSLDSSSRLVRGLGALMLLWFQGHTAEEIAAV